MIERIYIKDFALIDELEVQFGQGLNILTGQTGAGKSIIIGALNMILGERADTEVIRQGASKAIAEAEIFAREDIRIYNLLEQQQIDVSEPIILRREIRQKGSRAFINDTPVSVSVLHNIGDLLVDLHGQHDHQLLLKEEHHRTLVDAFPDVEAASKAYQKAYEEAKQKRKELKDIRAREQEIKEKAEMYRYQLNELEEAELDTGRIAEMEEEMHKLDHAEDLDRLAGMINELGYDAEINVMDMLGRIQESLQQMAEIESEFKHYVDELNTATISLRELLDATERYRNSIEFNPKRLDHLRTQRNELKRLEKKYNRTPEELLAYRDELREELDLAENLDLAIERKSDEFNKSLELLSNAAKELREARKLVGEKIGSQICEILNQLDIPHAQFRLHQTWLEDENGWATIDGVPVSPASHGCEHIAFYISTNKGEEPRPMAKTASGGEISRVMLALKSVLAEEHHLPVMIFDEIDSGISGAVAEQVGKTMRRLSAKCQIIAITHQAQIASQANHHFRVKKHEEGDRTQTYLKPLDNEAHIREVASLISGTEISEHAVASARELVAKATEE